MSYEYIYSGKWSKKKGKKKGKKTEMEKFYGEIHFSNDNLFDLNMLNSMHVTQ